MRERRCYELWIPTNVVCSLLGNWRRCQFVALPWLERCADGNGNKVDLPPDYYVEDATYSWQRDAIGIRISHPSFPEVPQGEYAPALYYREVTIEMRKVVGPDDEDMPGPLIVEAMP